MSDALVISSTQQQSSTRTGMRVAPATLFLAASMFMTGLAGLVNEYILATTATYIMGNSIYQWSMIIAVMMGMMALGTWIQKGFSDRGLVEKFAAIEVTLALIGGFAPLINYWIFAVQPELYAASSLMLVAAIGLFIGFEIPLVMRINQTYVKELKDNAAWVFGLDYFGAVVGAGLWIYLLLPNFPLTELSFIVSGANFVVAAVTWTYFSWNFTATRKIVGAVILVVTLAALTWGYHNNRNWSFALEQKFYDARVIHASTSKYQHMVLTEDGITGGVELYLNGKKQFSSLDENIYHECLVHPAMSLAERRSRVLILGGGDGLALREVLKYADVEAVTLVDLDPAIIELAKTHPFLRKLNGGAFDSAKVSVVTDPAVLSEQLLREAVYMDTGTIDAEGRPVTEQVASVEVLNLDASIFLNSVQDRFDVIIVDFPDPESPELVKLYSREVFMRMRERLAANGLLSIQATSPYHAKDAYLTIGETMRAAGLSTIPYHENVPSFGEWGWYLASRGHEQRSELIAENIRNQASYDVQTSYLTPELFRASLTFGKGWLESDRVEVNTLANPVLLDHYLRYAWKID